jgi:hypothetical protein
VDASELRGAYDELLAVAVKGRFRSPSTSGWDASTVLAHVVLTDRLLREVTEAVLSRSTLTRMFGRGRPTYDDSSASDDRRLRRLVRSSGGYPELVRLVSYSADASVSLVEQLSDNQSATPVHVRITDGYAVIVDEVRPWSEQLSAYARRRLPQHTAELRALRPARPVQSRRRRP